MMLDKIVVVKKREIEQAKAKIPLSELVKQSASFRQLRNFKEAISRPGKINLIAEIKKASPSKGLLREDFEPVKIAQAYEACGASALSILTDKEFFQGDLGFLQAVRTAVALPILRKDFIIDHYQIYQSACAGADAVLLIAQILSQARFKEFYSLCIELKLGTLCEVHDEEDLEKVLHCDCEIIGINNRNLRTFEEDLQISASLLQKIPSGKVVVSESAIKSFADVKYLHSLGVNAVLIGEAFMRSQDIGLKVKQIMGY